MSICFSSPRHSATSTTRRRCATRGPRPGTVLRNGREKGEAAEIRHGRNARSVWTIATQPYPDAHFATFPEELPRRCILAGTSARGCCPECGAPWVREVHEAPVRIGGNGGVTKPHSDGPMHRNGGGQLDEGQIATCPPISEICSVPTLAHLPRPRPRTVLQPVAQRRIPSGA